MSDDLKKKDKEEREAAKLEFETFASSYGGQIWLRNMAKSCLCGKQTFTGNSQTYFNEGVRSVGDAILRETSEAHPVAFASIMKEIYNG